MIAFIPEAHTLFTVVQFTLSGSPAYFAACRAGAPERAVAGVMRFATGPAPFDGAVRMRTSVSVLTEYDMVVVINPRAATLTGLAVNGVALRSLPTLSMTALGGSGNMTVTNALGATEVFAFLIRESDTGVTLAAASLGIPGRTVPLAAGETVYLLEPCGPADVAQQGGIAGADGVLDNNDFVVFIDWFFAQLPEADRGVTGGIPGSDGAFDNNDFVVFIDQFFAGC